MNMENELIIEGRIIGEKIKFVSNSQTHYKGERCFFTIKNICKTNKKEHILELNCIALNENARLIYSQYQLNSSIKLQGRLETNELNEPRLLIKSVIRK